MNLAPLVGLVMTILTLNFRFPTAKSPEMSLLQ